MSTSESPADLRLSSVLLPIVEGWRVVLGLVILAGAVTAALVGTSPRQFKAIATLSAVAGGRSASLGGNIPGIGQLLGSGGSNGLQATPQFIRVLTEQEGVLERVAAAPIAEGSPRRIIDSLAAVTGGEIADRDATTVLRKLIKATVDKETGVIMVSAQMTDSALARRTVDALVREVSTTFTRVARAQAVELRDAMGARVDSAQRQLARAEDALRAFQSSNRSFQEYSTASVQQQRLERVVSLASAVYTQAVTERESSVGKALEETPAVVVVDPVPRHVPRVGRGTVVKAIAAGLFAALLASLVLVARASNAGLPTDRALERERWRRALRSIPLVGRVLQRMFLPALPATGAAGQRIGSDEGDGSPLRVA
jgi:uncharacterized protein involved in exopolysaccharide biosynthesis